MCSRGVIAAPFLRLFPRWCAEQDGLQILVRKVLMLMAVMAVVRMTVAMLQSRRPNVQSVQSKGGKAAEQQADGGNCAEAATCVVMVSPTRRANSHCLDQRGRLVGHFFRRGRRPCEPAELVML